jgi:HAD superfamily hydrolase (TIGR01490 family)
MKENRAGNNNVAAFFDIDGTSVRAPSLEWRMFLHLARASEMRPSAVGHWTKVFLTRGFQALWRNSIMPVRLPAVDRNKHYLAGVGEGMVAKWAENYIASLPTSEFFPEALAQFNWHRECGHRIFLVSGTLAPLARAVARRLAHAGEITVIATELESRNGLLTGVVAGEAICGPAKARAMARLAARFDLDVTCSYAYGNSSTDRWMLAVAGHAVAVNPAAPLARLARRLGWRIVRWNEVTDSVQRKSSQPNVPEEGLIWK